MNEVPYLTKSSAAPHGRTLISLVMLTSAHERWLSIGLGNTNSPESLILLNAVHLVQH